MPQPFVRPRRRSNHWGNKRATATAHASAPYPPWRSAKHGMKRTRRFRLFVVCSFLILVAAVGYAAQSAATPGPAPRSENASVVAAALGAARARVAGAIAGRQSGSLLAVSGGASFVAPTTFYARSRAAAALPADSTSKTDSSSLRTQCASDATCAAANEQVAGAEEAAAADNAQRDGRIGGRLGLAAVGIAAGGGLIAPDEMARGANENVSPAHWFIAAGHFGDTTNVGLGLHGPWAPPTGSPSAPWFPTPCYAPGTCAMRLPNSPPLGNGDPAQDPPPDGSPNDPGTGNQDPSNNAGTDAPDTDGDPNTPPVIATTTTPEPSTVFLLATGLGLIALIHTRRRRVAIEAR